MGATNSINTDDAQEVEAIRTTEMIQSSGFHEFSKPGKHINPVIFQQRSIKERIKKIDILIYDAIKQSYDFPISFGKIDLFDFSEK